MNKVDLGLGGGTLLQIAEREHTQMMGYLIKTDGGKCIMIDSANRKRAEDGENLYRLISENGGYIDAWFITHAHSDHIGALCYILEKYGDKFEIGRLYFDFPSMEILNRINGKEDNFCVEKLYEQIEKRNIRCEKIKRGDRFDFGVTVEVLNDGLRDCEKYEDTNDTGFCFKVGFKSRDVLFLGDIGVAAQDNLIQDAGDKLKCDIVQMAHHGQNGCDMKVYRKIQPKVCLWPTPVWLWNNDSGEGIGSGDWKTLQTRYWMECLNVKEHYVSKDGDYLFY